MMYCNCVINIVMYKGLSFKLVKFTEHNFFSIQIAIILIILPSTINDKTAKFPVGHFSGFRGLNVYIWKYRATFLKTVENNTLYTLNVIIDGF